MPRPGPGFAIESCTSPSHPGWLALRRALWPHCTDGEHYAEMAAFCAEPARYAQFLARDAEGGAAGFAEASLRRDFVNGTQSAPVGFLEGLYVAPASRGRGAARALVQAAEAWARGAGCREMALDAAIDGEAAHATYRALGYAETERAVFFAKPLSGEAREAPGAHSVAFRRATPADAEALAVLGTQVFLDTYATEGVRPTVAREVLATFSPTACAGWLSDPRAVVEVAEREGHVVGFAHLVLGASHPLAPPGEPAELLRLYVQRPLAGLGLGTTLLRRAEHAALEAGAAVLWLTAWVHNARALAFYAARGYSDCGATPYRFEGEVHENRVVARRLPPHNAGSPGPTEALP